MKRRRRISVGEHVTLLFENLDTIRFQIQEMIRAERIVDPGRVQEELDVYNALLPAEGELSATLFIELTDNERLKEDLDGFKGIDRGKTVCLKVPSAVVRGEHNFLLNPRHRDFSKLRRGPPVPFEFDERLAR